MKKPKCRLCGINHWSTEPHKYESRINKSKEDLVEVRKASRPSSQQKPVVDSKKSKDEGLDKVMEGTVRKQEWREKNRDRYNEYQREYMRRRRTK